MTDTGIDDALKMEAVYLTAPIPQNLAVLTVLGAVFDKVYFPGVYMPKSGYDEAELEKEIARLQALPTARTYDTSLLIGMLQMVKHAKTLEGFCDFTAAAADPLGRKDPISPQAVAAVYDAIHGPPPPGFIPSFSTGHTKGLPGGDEVVVYPGNHHYIAGAIIHSGRTGVPLLNDIPGLTIPGVTDSSPADDAKLLAAMLAVECTRIALPPTPILRPQDLMEFRSENADLLRGFRRSMLRYAKDLNGKIVGISADELAAKTKFFVETEIVPVIDELNDAMNSQSRSWHKRAVGGLTAIYEIGGAYMVGGKSAALAKAVSSLAAQFFIEVAARGDKNEALKRSGLMYLMRLQKFHRENS